MDNFVQNSGLSTQGYNRYSYANGNPLKFTDPDGEALHIVIGAIIGGVANVAVGVLNGEIHDPWDVLVYAGTGAAIGALAAATGGASLAATGLTGASVAGGALAGATAGLVGGGLQGATNAAYQTIRYNAPSSRIVEGAVWGAGIGFVGGGLIGGVMGGLSKSLKAPKIEVDLNDLENQFPNPNTADFPGGSTSKNGQITPYHPDNFGAAGSWEKTVLPKGTILDRYGYDTGNFLSPVGTPFEMRSLPPQTNLSNPGVG